MPANVIQQLETVINNCNNYTSEEVILSKREISKSNTLLKKELPKKYGNHFNNLKETINNSDSDYAKVWFCSHLMHFIKNKNTSKPYLPDNWEHAVDLSAACSDYITTLSNTNNS